MASTKHFLMSTKTHHILFSSRGLSFMASPLIVLCSSRIHRGILVIGLITVYHKDNLKIEMRSSSQMVMYWSQAKSL